MAGPPLPNVGLPFPTKAVHQTKIQVILHEKCPTKPYRNLCSRCETHWWFWFGLRYITTAYQSADLALSLPHDTFTNHYHREEGDTHGLRLIG